MECRANWLGFEAWILKELYSLELVYSMGGKCVGMQGELVGVSSMGNE